MLFLLLIIWAIFETIVILCNYSKRREMDKKYKYIKEYNQKNIVQINLKFNKNTDSDIINFLDTLDNKQEFFKDIIKKELTKNNI